VGSTVVNGVSFEPNAFHWHLGEFRHKVLPELRRRGGAVALWQHARLDLKRFEKELPVGSLIDGIAVPDDIPPYGPFRIVYLRVQVAHGRTLWFIASSTDFERVCT
jgi:hypothetical protein